MSHVELLEWHQQLELCNRHIDQCVQLQQVHLGFSHGQANRHNNGLIIIAKSSCMCTTDWPRPFSLDLFLTFQTSLIPNPLDQFQADLLPS